MIFIQLITLTCFEPISRVRGYLVLHCICLGFDACLLILGGWLGPWSKEAELLLLYQLVDRVEQYRPPNDQGVVVLMMVWNHLHSHGTGVSF